MTTVIIDPTAAGSLALVQELSNFAKTQNLGEGVYQVEATETEVDAITAKYPMAVLKVEGA